MSFWDYAGSIPARAILMWEYRAEVDRVVDGDTVDFTVDLGFNVQTKIRTRLLGVDTHETYGVSHDSEEYELGKRETEWVQEWFDEADSVTIKTQSTGKYGRWLATIQREDGECLNDRLVDEFDVSS